MTWTVRVLKWAEFQHYKGRNPPWVKLHRRLLDKREWRLLPASAAKLLVDVWVLAAEHGGEVRLSPYDLAWRLRLEEPAMTADLETLASLSFIELCLHPASDVLAPRLQDARPEGESETEPEAVKGASATHSGRAPRAGTPQGPTDGQLMQAVRRSLYAPDGQPPAGYNDGRDVTVIHALRRKRYSGDDILDAIEGLAILRERGELDWLLPGQKATMRALYNTRTGVRPVFALAQEARAKAPSVRRETHATPEHIGGPLRRLGVSA